MRSIISMVVVAILLSTPVVAQQHDHAAHLEMLKAYLVANSSHGPIVPQPASINPAVARTIDITARAFSFTPSTITVDQGDVVTLRVSVPNSDTGNGGHGILMETYIENGGEDVAKGQTKEITFTATTAGTFAWVCTNSGCGDG